MQLWRIQDIACIVMNRYIACCRSCCGCCSCCGSFLHFRIASYTLLARLCEVSSSEQYLGGWGGFEIGG
jgi:hypothetical protein